MVVACRTFVVEYAEPGLKGRIGAKTLYNNRSGPCGSDMGENRLPDCLHVLDVLGI